MPGQLRSKGLYSLDKDNTDTRQGAGASTVISFRHPNAPAVKPRQVLQLRPKPVLCLDPAKLRQPLPQVSQVLRTVARPGSVPYMRFVCHRLRLPYGRWVTEDGTKVLYNRRYEPLFIWPAGADKPERCKPHHVHGIVEEGWFYSDVSSEIIGRAKLWHALETMLDAWERDDRAAAGVLEEWLLGKHLVYLELTRAHREDLAQWRAERDLLDDILYGPRSPAKPA
jgi:hypothetical protein